MGVLEEAEACLRRLEGTADAQRATLLRGLDLTGAAFCPSGQPAGDALPAGPSSSAYLAGGEPAAAVCRLRLRILQHLERLDTAVALMNG